MQVYVVAMALAVALGTLFDLFHKRSPVYFARRRKESTAAASRTLEGRETASLFLRTLLGDVAAAGEFCNPRRRLSRLSMSYGFVLYLIATVAMIFVYPDPAGSTPLLPPILWNIGAAMILAGGSRFFSFLRGDVAHEARSPLRLVRADLYIACLPASATFTLVWEIVLVEKANIERSGAVAHGLSAINCDMGMRWDENRPEDYVRYARNDLMGLVREDLGFDITRPVDSTVHKFEEWGLPIMRDPGTGRYLREGR